MAVLSLRKPHNLDEDTILVNIMATEMSPDHTWNDGTEDEELYTIADAKWTALERGMLNDYLKEIDGDKEVQWLKENAIDGMHIRQIKTPREMLRYEVFIKLPAIMATIWKLKFSKSKGL